LLPSSDRAPAALQPAALCVAATDAFRNVEFARLKRTAFGTRTGSWCAITRNGMKPSSWFGTSSAEFPSLSRLTTVRTQSCSASTQNINFAILHPFKFSTSSRHVLSHGISRVSPSTICSFTRTRNPSSSPEGTGAGWHVVCCVSHVASVTATGFVVSGLNAEASWEKLGARTVLRAFSCWDGPLGPFEPAFGGEPSRSG
jgi:hypothetical protein